jgi:hypothetical protein
MHKFCFLTSKPLLDFVIIIIIIIVIIALIFYYYYFVIITQMLQIALFCTMYVCMCLFLSFTLAHFVTDPWAVELARTYSSYNVR